MEGRFMLSGTAPDFATLDIFDTQFSVGVYRVNVAPAPTAHAADVQGGFILPGDAMSYHGNNNSSAGGFSSQFQPGVLIPPPPSPSVLEIADLDGSGLDFVDVYVDGSPDPRIVVAPNESNPDIAVTYQEPLGGSPTIGTSADEGGAIPIQPIIALVERPSSSESLLRLVSNAALRSDANWKPSAGAKPTHGLEIAGEWARPSMLEMAGGEPASIRQPSASKSEVTPRIDGDEAAPTRQPLSSRDVSKASPVVSSPHPTMEVTRGTVETSHSQYLADAHPMVRPVPHRSPSLISESHVIERTSLSESAMLAEIPDADASAHHEVFEQLGRTDSEAMQLFVGSDTWRQSWKATPLLMILALERIAASNSRRAKKPSSSVDQRPRPCLPDEAETPDPA
jgi:hypothetical protein